MFEFSEIFHRFMPSTWSKRGVVGDYYEEGETATVTARRGWQPSGSAAVMCASALVAFGLTQPVQAENIAVPGFTARASETAAGKSEQNLEERISEKHLGNVVNFVRSAPRIYRSTVEPDPSF